MSKENLQDILERCLTKDTMNLIFIKPEEAEKMLNQPLQPLKSETPMSPEEQLLKIKNSFGIKVQSVVLPVKHQLFALKSEAQVLDWLQNKIHNNYSAFYQFNNKYNDDAEQVSWNNNKMQNQRYLNTSGR